MNETNANRIKLQLPPVIANITGDRSMIKRTIGRSGNSVYAVGKDLYLKVSPHIEDLRRERDTDIWLEGKLPGGISIPRVGAYDEVIHPISGEMLGYLLTSSVSGTPASSPPYIKDPTRLCNLLADAVRIFHELSPEGCPAPADKLRPGDVVIHGDFCLPNILLHRSRVNGYVDLGHVTVGDPWEDYAWCLWSLEYNLKTDAYNPLLLDALGLTFDKEKYNRYTKL